MNALLTLASGALFGAGLIVSGMADPRNVIAFLNITGHWNPSLAFVMIGAIAVHAPLYFFIRKRTRPWFATSFRVREDATITSNLVAGSVLFGIGWGLGGYCPGPALVATAASWFQGPAALFTVCMIVGMRAMSLLRAQLPKRPTQDASPEVDSCG